MMMIDESIWSDALCFEPDIELKLPLEACLIFLGCS